MKTEPRARLLHEVFELFHSLSSIQFPSDRFTTGNSYLNCLTATVKEDTIHDPRHTCSTFCNGWYSYIFGRPYFVATFSCGLVEVTYVSSTVQILEMCSD